MAGWALAFAALTGIGAIVKVPLTPVPVTMQVFSPCWRAWHWGRYGARPARSPTSSWACAAPPSSPPSPMPAGGALRAHRRVSLGLRRGRRGGRIHPGEEQHREYRAPSRCQRFRRFPGRHRAIYACGAIWLAAWLGGHGSSGWLAWNLGIKPFIVVDLLKGAAAATLVLGGGAALSRRRRKPRAI